MFNFLLLLVNKSQINQVNSIKKTEEERKKEKKKRKKEKKKRKKERRWKALGGGRRKFV